MGPEGTTFSAPVTLSVKYDPNLIPPEVTESSLTLAFVSGSTWTDIPTTVDTVKKLLIGQITHFSTLGSVIADSNKLPYGSLLGSFNDVNVYSNGCIDPSVAPDPKTGKIDPNLLAKCMAVNHQIYPDTYNTNNLGGYNSGLQWQCVEFINRYYYQTYGQDIRVGFGNAQDYFSDTLSQMKGLVKYFNDGSSLPQVGDIIVSTGSANNVGHVAIVRAVTTNSIHLAQQNYTETIGDSDFVLSITSENKVADFSSSYPVTGWLRSAGWLSFKEGNPGIPGDGVFVNASTSDMNWPSALSFSLAKEMSLGQFTDGFTLTVFLPPTVPDPYTFQFDMLIEKESCAAALGMAPTALCGSGSFIFNGVEGKYINIDKSTIDNLLNEVNTIYHPGCGVTAQDIFITSLILFPKGSTQFISTLDAAIILPGQNALPTQ